MSNKFAATLPAGHSLGLAAGSHRSSRKSPKSARKTHEPLKELYDEKSVVLTQAALRRRLAVEERSRLVRSRARRIRILKEIIATERDYVNNLAILVESFLTSLVKCEDYADVLKPKLQQEFALVLPGVEMIRSYHVTLLAALNDIDIEDPYFEVGGIFLDVVMYFKSYSQYVSHYQVIVQILAQRKQDTELQQIFESLKPQALGKGLKDYMIMPVQRIPRYALLLHDMLRHTWRNHPDVAALSAAYNKVLDIAHNIENMSADAVSIAKVFELSSCFLSNGEVFKLVVPHRRYIADAECLCSLPAKGIVMKNLQVFLFNDIIIWAKAKKDNKFNVVYTMPTLMLSNICLADLWQDGGGAEFIEMETLDSERLRMMVLEKNDEWFQFLELTKNNGKAWLPHHTSRDVSTTARYLTVGGEAAKAARQSPKVKDTNKSKNKSMKLLGALRVKKSKVDVRDLGWILSGKEKEKEGEVKGASPATASTRVVSLDLEKVSGGGKERKLSSRPKSSRSTRDKLDAKSSTTFKRTMSDRGTKDKMIFSSEKHWSDDGRGREREREKRKDGKTKEREKDREQEKEKEKEKDRERERDKEDKEKDKEKERDREKDRDRTKDKEKSREREHRQKSKEAHKRVKRRPSRQDVSDQLGSRRRGSSGGQNKLKDTSPKRGDGSEKAERKKRKGSGSISAEDEGEAALLLDVKSSRHGRRHRKVSSSDQSPSFGRRHSGSSLSPSPKIERRGEDSSEREEISHSRKERKKRSHKSSSKSKKSKASVDVVDEDADSPSVPRKSYSLTHVPSPRESTSVAPEAKAQRRTRSRKTSSSSAMDDSSEEADTGLLHAVSTPAVISTAPDSSGATETDSEEFETAVNPKKLERARNARAVLRNAQRESLAEMMPTPPVSRHSLASRKGTDGSGSNLVAVALDRASKPTLDAPVSGGKKLSTELDGRDKLVRTFSPSRQQREADAGLPLPSSLDNSDASDDSLGSSASPSVTKKKSHRRVRSIGARVSPSISRSPGAHKRRRSGSSMAHDDPEAAQPGTLASAAGNESVRDLVEVFMSAQKALLSSPADKRSSTPLASTAHTTTSADAEIGSEDSGEAVTTKGRWRQRTGVAKRKFSSGSVPASTTCISTDRGMGRSRTGEDGKPIRCTPADFARHDSLQEMSTVSSLLGQFRAMTGEKGKPSEMSRIPQRMNSAEPSVAMPTLFRTRSNSLESPRFTDAGEEEKPSKSMEQRQKPKRCSSYSATFGKGITAATLVDCEFTSVTAIYGSLAQQGVKDPKVLERLQEAQDSCDGATSASNEESSWEEEPSARSSPSPTRLTASSQQSSSDN